MNKLSIQDFMKEAFKRNKSGMTHPRVHKLAEELIRRCWEEDVFIVFTDGLRTMEDQAVIYGKGRSSYVYKGKQYDNPKVKKVSNALPGSSFHNYQLALDFVNCDGYGKNIDWVVGAKWRRAAAIAKELGFTWGGDWASFRDYPHIQYDGGLSISQIQKGAFPLFKNNKVAAVPSINSTPQKTSDSTSEKKQIGIVKVLVNILNVREDASFSAKVVKTVKKGQSYKVYAMKNGMYNVGGKQWMSAGKKYTKFISS
ncbi:M15 family metallopeptidase [Sporosarcina sp. P17b]|uniref:M15 family metallopeptidase n=1 Tax=Sporosarcina sp. P17b TaxID=2048260 RepID=UPI000C171322|nr:M15 family metallopeptidase [Sporosarcina sp. P17b]PIC73357.1 hypothetical protein CSV76_11105 [Sporosarcina sp. P17b]